VFSDGEVWPITRLDEAERRGLDVVAITDHIEYQPHKQFIPKSYNAAWEIAGQEAKKRGITLIHGAEITRKMPPGHLNALFIQDASALADTNFMVVMEEAVKQGAFIQLNHPGWRGQRADGIPRLDSVHRVLFSKGWIHGIEIVNYNEFYPDVVDWCIDKRVAMTGNSDIHGPMSSEIVDMGIKKLPVTLVFAISREPEDIRKAMMAGRTMVWFNDSLAAIREISEAFFLDAITLGKAHFSDEKNGYHVVTNPTDIPFSLTMDPNGKIPVKLQVPARSSVRVKLPVATVFPIQAEVRNMMVRKGECLKTTLTPR
jgi:hypothetical protein